MTNARFKSKCLRLRELQIALEAFQGAAEDLRKPQRASGGLCEHQRASRGLKGLQKAGLGWVSLRGFQRELVGPHGKDK